MEIKEFCKKINAVPMSVIEDIKAEIESKTHPDYTGHNAYEMAVSDGYEGALLIIDKHISGEEQERSE